MKNSSQKSDIKNTLGTKNNEIPIFKLSHKGSKYNCSYHLITQALLTTRIVFLKFILFYNY